MKHPRPDLARLAVDYEELRRFRVHNWVEMLADDYAVSVSTMGRWLRDARAVGYLPSPPEKGKHHADRFG